MKTFLVIQKHAPHSSAIGKEVFDALLMGSAFATCTLLFLDDGIYQILGPQQPDQLEIKNHAVSYGALADYGVTAIYCCTEDLKARNIDTDELLIPVQVITKATARQLMADHDIILGL